MKISKLLILFSMVASLGISSLNAQDVNYHISDSDAVSAAPIVDIPCATNSRQECDDTFKLKLFNPSDRCFDNFISPMTNPVYFEDPRTVSEARFIYLHHTVPLAAGGGEIDLFAVQLRAAINERLSIIATKDGYMTSSNPLINDGFADVNAGLKYNIFRDPQAQRLLSTGLTYELPVGSTRSRQGNGDGTFHLFLTGGTQVGDRGHWISSAGLVLPADSAAESTWAYWSNHFDRQLCGTNLFPFFEVNWYHHLESGNGGIPGVEGGDLFNFGSTGVTGNNIVTTAIGMKYKPTRNTEVGVAFEVPATKRRDVIDNRITFDLILRY